MYFENFTKKLKNNFPYEIVKKTDKNQAFEKSDFICNINLTWVLYDMMVLLIAILTGKTKKQEVQKKTE